MGGEVKKKNNKKDLTKSSCAIGDLVSDCGGEGWSL